MLIRCTRVEQPLSPNQAFGLHKPQRYRSLIQFIICLNKFANSFHPWLSQHNNRSNATATETTFTHNEIHISFTTRGMHNLHINAKTSRCCFTWRMSNMYAKMHRNNFTFKQTFALSLIICK